MGGDVKGKRQVDRKWVGQGRKLASGVACQRVVAPEERGRSPLLITGDLSTSHKEYGATFGRKEASSCSRWGGNPYIAVAAQSRSFYVKNDTG